jgi:hypothetical protein
VEAWVAQAIRRGPDVVALQTKLGTIRIREGRFDEAEVLCRR